MGRLLQTPYRVDEDSCVHQSDVSLPRTTTGTRPRRRARGSATTPRTAVMELYRPMLATASAAPSAVRPRAAGSGGRVRGAGSFATEDIGEFAARLYDYHREHRELIGLPRWEALTVEAEVPEEEQRSTYCGRKTAAIQDGQPEVCSARRSGRPAELPHVRHGRL